MLLGLLGFLSETFAATPTSVTLDTLLSIESESIQDQIQTELRKFRQDSHPAPFLSNETVRKIVEHYEDWKSQVEVLLNLQAASKDFESNEAAYLAVYLRLTEKLAILLSLQKANVGSSSTLNSALQFAEKNKITVTEELYEGVIDSIRNSPTWVGNELSLGRTPFITTTVPDSVSSKMTLHLDTSRMVSAGKGNSYRRIDEKNLLEIIQISSLSDLIEQLYRTHSLLDAKNGTSHFKTPLSNSDSDPSLPLNRLLGGISHFENQIDSHQRKLFLKSGALKLQRILVTGLTQGAALLPSFFDSSLLECLFKILGNPQKDQMKMVQDFFSNVEKEAILSSEIANLIPLSYFNRPLPLSDSTLRELMKVKWTEIKANQILGGLRVLSNRGIISYTEDGSQDALTEAVEARKKSYFNELKDALSSSLILQKTLNTALKATSLAQDDTSQSRQWNSFREELVRAAKLIAPDSDKKIGALPVEPSLVYKTLHKELADENTEALALELNTLPTYSEQLTHYSKKMAELTSNSVIKQGRVVPALVEEFLHQTRLNPDFSEPSTLHSNSESKTQFLTELEKKIGESKKNKIKTALILGEKCGFHRIFIESALRNIAPTVSMVFSDEDERTDYIQEKRIQLRTTYSLLSLETITAATLGEALIQTPSQTDALLVQALEKTEEKILDEINLINTAKTLDAVQSTVMNGGSGLSSKFMNQADTFSPLLKHWLEKKQEMGFRSFLYHRYGSKYITGGFTALLLLELSKPILKRVPFGKGAASILSLALQRSKPWIRRFITTTAIISLADEALEFKNLWSTIPKTIEDLDDLETSHPFAGLDDTESTELFAENPFAVRHLQAQKTLTKDRWMWGGGVAANTFLLYFQVAKGAINRLGERMAAHEIREDIAAKRVLGMFPSARKMEKSIEWQTKSSEWRRVLPNRWDVEKSFSWTKKRLIAEGKQELIPIAERAYRRLMKKVLTHRTWDPEIVFQYHLRPALLAVRYASGKKWITLSYEEWQKDLAAFQTLKTPAGDFFALEASLSRAITESGKLHGLDPKISEAYAWLKRRIETTGAWNNLSKVKIGPKYSSPTEKKLIEILEKSDSEAAL